MRQRQVNRLTNYCDELMREEATRQIESALVLHLDLAWTWFKYVLKVTFQGKCCVCGNRHLGSLDRRGEGYLFFCGYGWQHNFTAITKGTWFHLLHGED